MTPESILKELYNNVKDGKAWDKALDQIHIYANNKNCECKKEQKTGTTTWACCNICGKIDEPLKS